MVCAAVYSHNKVRINMYFIFPFVFSEAASSTGKKIISRESLPWEWDDPEVTTTNQSSHSQNEQTFGIPVLFPARWVNELQIKLFTTSQVLK
jgi:hypothetical protein